MAVLGSQGDRNEYHLKTHISIVDSRKLNRGPKLLVEVGKGEKAPLKCTREKGQGKRFLPVK